MDDREAFINKIAENVYDDAPRLVFADWLDEHGEEALAEFIRVQVELEPIRDLYEIPRAAELHAREKQLTQKFRELKQKEGQTRLSLGAHVDYRRGFVDRLRCPTNVFLEHGAALRLKYSTVRRTVIHCLNGWGQRLSECAALEGLAELELACWYSNDDLEALGKSPYLSKLQVLVLWMNHKQGHKKDSELGKIAAKANAWPNLREIVLFDPQGDYQKQIAKAVQKTNQLLGREIARYQRGYPELFPINANIHRDFPIAGHLSDGRAAALDCDHTYSSSPVLTLQTFDANGRQSGEKIQLPNVDNVYTESIPLAHKLFGFEPGFIRVQQGALGDYGPWRGFSSNWDSCGEEDDPENPINGNGDPDPDGWGGQVYWLIDEGQFTVGYDCWADKRGVVHST